jgi:hypothetical protein
MIDILPASFLGLGLISDQQPESYPAKTIVAWEDGARIERPISPDYRYFAPEYVRWRQRKAEISGPWGGFPNCFGREYVYNTGLPWAQPGDAHFVYRAPGSSNIFFWKSEKACYPQHVSMFFDNLQDPCLSKNRRMHLLWFWISHLKLSIWTDPHKIEVIRTLKDMWFCEAKKDCLGKKG